MEIVTVCYYLPYCVGVAFDHGIHNFFLHSEDCARCSALK